ncbi:MAG TPA: hypothetical protein VF832_17770 [Longimicrobiales bacterium]
MGECVCLPRCPFFNDRMANMPATAQLIKNRYCLGVQDSCARHMVFEKLGSPAVPADLYPTQVERAKEVLALRG